MDIEVSLHMKEDIIALCSVVAFNSKLKDAARKLAREITKINQNKSQYSGCSNDYTTKHYI